MEDYHAPPPHPPPLLSFDDVQNLLSQGHLPLTLPVKLQECMESLRLSSGKFFQQPDDVKSATYPASHHTESGYYDVNGEKEYVTFRRIQNADNVTELDSLVRKMWQLTTSILTRVLYDLSAALNIPYDAWTPLLDGCLNVPLGDVDTKLPTLLRVFKYMPNKGTAGVHTDNGLLTLCDGRDNGLQVFVPDIGDTPGYWKDADGPTILIGDTLRILSWGRARAGRHRVIANNEGRSSIVFALRASLRAPEVDLTPFGDVGNRVCPADLYKHMNSRKHNINQRKPVKPIDESTGQVP